MYQLLDKDGKELSQHNLQDKSFWCVEGESIEHAFVRHYGVILGLSINPEKHTNKYAPDLTNDCGQLGDLKTQNTPMFSAGRYGFDDPSYVVVFNLKDKERYEVHYPRIDIFFWVKWIAVRYVNRGQVTTVEPIDGVWKIPFQDLSSLCKKAPIHSYVQRVNDNLGNAKASYVLDIRDKSFTKLV